MKKVSIIAAAALAAALGLSSCTTGRYANQSANFNLNQTQVVLSEANFKVVKTVSTSVVYKQDIEFTPEQLKQSAYAALVREADLTGSQALINVTMERVNRDTDATFLGIGLKKHESAVLVSGVVIEFTK